MKIGAEAATQLYDKALNAAQPGLETNLGDAGGSMGDAAPATFGDAVAEMAQTTVNTALEGERQAALLMSGAADPHSVVEALAATELALEMAVTVRDKVVEAYQEVLRMPV